MHGSSLDLLVLFHSALQYLTMVLHALWLVGTLLLHRVGRLVGLELCGRGGGGVDVAGGEGFGGR